MRLVSRRARSSLRSVSSTKPGTPPNRPSAAAAARTGPTAHTLLRPCSQRCAASAASMTSRGWSVSSAASRGTRTGTHGARPRSGALGAACAGSCREAVCRSGRGTRTGRLRRRATVLHRGSPARARTAGPGARASSSCAWPGWSTHGRPCRPRSTRRRVPRPIAPLTAPGTRTPDSRRAASTRTAPSRSPPRRAAGGRGTGPIRSQGLSVRQFMAMAHSSTARMRRRIRWAVCAFVCQIGPRISSTSVLSTSETGT